MSPLCWLYAIIRPGNVVVVTLKHPRMSERDLLI